jgi:peptidoglycan hydrolase-like protein with peptidoglycan-binding domain
MAQQKGKSAPAASQKTPDPAILQLQNELKQQGFYLGNPDGIAGEATTRAVAARDAKLESDRQAQAQAEERALRKIELEAKGATAKAAAEDTASKTKAREERQTQASSPAGIATQIAATTAAPLAGVAVGRSMGLGINDLMDKSQASKNAALAGVAADRAAGLTTREGALTAALRSGAMPSGNSVARVGGRMLPHMALGGFMAGKGGVLLSQENPEGAFYPEMFNKGAALGMLGAGTGIAERGITYGMSPGVAPDARAMAVVGSNQLRRGGAGGQGTQAPQSAPDEPAPPPRAGTKAFMQAQAKELGIKGTSGMSKGELAQALADNLSEHGAKRTTGKRIPKIPSGAGAAALAGGLAYGLTPDRANAATGEPTSNQAEAMTNAGIAGGAAYGTSKLAQALAPALRGGLGMVGEAMAPASIDAMTDYSDADLAQGRNMLARTLPQALQGGAVDQARQMATVPERGPQAQMAQDQRLQAEAMPMQSAQALQIPEGIPAPNPDGSSPYGEAIANRINRMVRLGAPPEAIANLLNQAVR